MMCILFKKKNTLTYDLPPPSACSLVSLPLHYSGYKFKILAPLEMRSIRSELADNFVLYICTWCMMSAG